MSSSCDRHGPATHPAAYSQRWRLGLGALTWRAEDRAYAGLLEALTRERGHVLRQTQELAAPAAPLTRSAIDADLERGARAELAVFRAALEDFRTRAGADEKTEVAYDSRNPDQDTWADILIQYLVRTGYAEVRTEEPEAWHYRYWIRIDWERLGQLARGEGHALPD